MKSFVKLFLISILVFFTFSGLGQIDLEKTVTKKVEKKVKREVNKTIDKSLETDKKKEDSPKNETASNDESNAKNDSEKVMQDDDSKKNLKIWSKYDFVPGDKVIFEDNLSGEKHGEFPSRWNLVGGNAEIGIFGDENVIAFMKNQTEISPLMKTKEYLPEIFTVEFDIYYFNKGNEAYYLNLKDQKQMTIRAKKVSLGKFEGEPEESSRETGWHHIALSFNQRALKVYFDHTRVLNIPNIEKRPTSLTISALSHGGKKGDPSMIKNIRIAEGGVELYDKLLTDGKIITRGIYFDVGKSTIKPESMGVINEIVKLMNDHPDIKFSVEGHTDSDGNDAFNQKLSEDRAGAVKAQLIESGIESARLESKGHGESMPVDDNSTPEGKANNRRVEFIRI